jgi:hypothetical protein
MVERLADYRWSSYANYAYGKKEPDWLITELILYLVWQQGHQTNQQMGDLFGLTYSAVSRRISIFKNLILRDNQMKKKLEHIKSKIKI